MAIPDSSSHQPLPEGEEEEEDPVSPALNPNSMDQQQHEEEEVVAEDDHNQPDPPQASETLALEQPDPQDPQPQLSEHFINHHDPSDQGESTDLSPRIADVNALVFSAAVSRRGSKRKKWSMRRRFLQEKSQKKHEILIGTFKPVPFVPVKNLDFSTHEKLLKRLGLWDFVHIKFDRVLRHDLLLQLVASFNSSLRYSYVNGSRIGVNRADLARALRLPVKKMAVVEDGEEDTIASEESIAFIEDFVSNWLLLHEDTWMMPNEVMNWTKVIKDGHFERVDWAGLIWFMVEKELMQSPQLVNCYYASHLQCLIRSQREDLLKEETPKVEEVELKEEVEDEPEQEQGQEQGQEQEQEKDVDRDDEDEVCNESPKMIGNDDSMVKKLEEHSIELCLGPNNVDKVDVQQEKASVGNIMDLMEMKEQEQEEQEQAQEQEQEEEREKEDEQEEQEQEQEREKEKDEEQEQEGQWLLDGKGSGLEPLLRRCNTHEFKEFDFGNKKKAALEEEEEEEYDQGKEAEEEEDEEEGDDQGKEAEEEDEEENEDEEEEENEEDREDEFRLMPRSNPIDGFPSSQFIDEMETEPINFNSEFEIHGHSVQFLPPRDDSRMSSGGCIPFVNSNKRVIDPDIGNPAQSLNGGNKRLRSEGPLDFNKCMDSVQHWLDKARVMYAEKEQVHQQATMNQQYLIHELEQRETFIEHLRKAKFEEEQKMQSDIYRLEHELYVMGNLLDGYRKALKETDKAFTDYRAQFPQSDEPLYRDVAGSGGLVLSIMELEKMRLKQAEEDRLNRLVVEKKFKALEDKFVDVFHGHLQEVSSLDNRLVDVGNEVKTMRESVANRKVPETLEPISTE